MPSCFAEDWVFISSTSGDAEYYVDFDTAWYKDQIGGFVSKYVREDGYAVTYSNKFRDYPDGVNIFVGTASVYYPSGSKMMSKYVGKKKFYERGSIAWNECMAVKNHCGY